MDGNSRNHPQIRAEISPNLALQERDRQILQGVYKYRLLSRKQIQSLFGFGSLTRVNTRLRQLFDAKLLDRIFTPVFWGSPEAYYCLGIRGAEFIAENAKEDIFEIKRKRRQILKTSSLFLKHQIAVNEVRIAFELIFNNFPDFQLQFQTDNIQIISNRGKVFIPDGYMVFLYQGRIFALFLEIDLGTETLNRIQEKAETYLAFGLSGEYQRQFGNKYFRVLFICSSLERLKNIKRVIEKKTDKMFWLTTTDKISFETIFTNIWQRPNQARLFSLIS